jgi:hypothetical protein
MLGVISAFAGNKQRHNFRISLDKQKISLRIAGHQRVPFNLGQQKFPACGLWQTAPSSSAVVLAVV